MGRRTALVVLVVALLALLGNWLAERRQARLEREGVGTEKSVDYFLNGFSATTQDAQGRISQRLEAERMTHYTDDSSTLTRPFLVIYRPDGARWELRAARGWTDPGEQWVYLEGDVTLERPDEAGSALLLTQWLRVLPNNNYAETDRPVTITRPGSRIEATGMQAFGEERRLVFLSQVRGTYEPAKP